MKIVCPLGHSEYFFRVNDLNMLRGDWLDAELKAVPMPERSQVQRAHGVFICDVCGIMFYAFDGSIQQLQNWNDDEKS